eukprot:CAMPEP_0119538582 /NCGR_PEP_ID=MMETSP1344-20130328/50975_1 /TAXON_ID=236787 /ORGANISM="Florenciella parvula, Strain CCMP2471" /LENGTH=63 /DNA_ID=CAMNT_0007581529 /DNA_START=10 /DNA_END=196 /DNA_ORIENTATION=-
MSRSGPTTTGAADSVMNHPVKPRCEDATTTGTVKLRPSGTSAECIPRAAKLPVARIPAPPYPT